MFWKKEKTKKVKYYIEYNDGIKQELKEDEFLDELELKTIICMYGVNFTSRTLALEKLEEIKDEDYYSFEYDDLTLHREVI